MRKLLLPAGFLLAFAAIACTRQSAPAPLPSEEADSSSSEEASSAPAQDAMRSYQGRLEELGPSIYMQGTHQLILPNGSFLLLESSVQDLQLYAGMEVEVAGPVRDTVEAGAEIMDVQEMTLIGPPASDSGASSSATEDERTSSASSSLLQPPAPPPASSAGARTSPPPAPVPPASSAEGGGLSLEMAARVKKMAKDKPESAWTQQYCSAHIGVCFPVRGDYWYRSYGTTTSSLWRVEISSEDIQSFGEGPLVVNLVSGRLDPSIADQSVQEKDGFVTGYRSWTGNRHFQISAPSALRGAVDYITRNIVPFEAPTEPAQGSSSSL